MEASIDGQYSLSETESAILFQEAAGYALTSLHSAVQPTLSATNASPTNDATFVRLLPIPTLPKELKLVEITGNNTPTSVLSQQLASGWSLICYGPVYVSGSISNVAAFRKL